MRGPIADARPLAHLKKEWGAWLAPRKAGDTGANACTTDKKQTAATTITGSILSPAARSAGMNRDRDSMRVPRFYTRPVATGCLIVNVQERFRT